MTVLVVTGTGTGVGKTVATAALAAVASADGQRVAVLKPSQTGVGRDEAGDVEEVRRLAGAAITVVELARYPEPLAPATAARRSGRPATTLEQVVLASGKLAAEHDLVLVEGAGGLLVRLSDEPPQTLADVAVALAAPVLVVAAAGLGTLNHTALTVEALHARRLSCAGVLIGSWPASPDVVAQCNLTDLPAVTGVPLLGALPAGMGALSPTDFLAAARALPALDPLKIAASGTPASPRQH